METFEELKAALNAGSVRSAEPDSSSPTGWRVNAWVKKGILLGFRLGKLENMSADHGRFPFFDKHTYPLKKFAPGLTSKEWRKRSLRDVASAMCSSTR